MRYVIHFGKHLDFDVLRAAIRLAIYAELIFSYFYKEQNETVYWQKQDEIDESLLIDLVESVNDTEIDINDFLIMEIPPFNFPLVKARIIRNDLKDVLCINMNHTPTDGSGLKEFVKRLASIYTHLANNKDYEMGSYAKQDRSLKKVTGNFSFIQKLNFILEGFRSRKKGITWSFDWNKSAEDNRKNFMIAAVGADSFDKIKAYGKVNNATINDVVLAAFIRSFIPTNKLNIYAAKPVIVPLDLRQYIKSTDNTGICSLTGSLICNIGKLPGNTFNETLTKVRDEMIGKKRVHAEMNMLTRISVLAKIMPYIKLKEQMMNHKMPPIPLVSNIGIIDPDSINFNSTPVDNAFIAGAISLGDFFCLSYSTFRRQMTFSIGYAGGEIQNQKVKEFLTSMKTELENIQ
jgi:NRPS condensation-like uncharacterized protein